MHEAFAAQTLANLQCLASDRFSREVLGRAQATGEVDESKFNVLGGSIAYGHPFAAEAIARIRERYEPAAELVDTTDGISIEYPEWRFNLRSSNTEPVVRLNVESKANSELMEKKTAELLALLC